MTSLSAVWRRAGAKRKLLPFINRIDTNREQSGARSSAATGEEMRYLALIIAIVGTLAFGALVFWSKLLYVPFAVCAVLSAVGVWDMVQTKHSLRRNYPILANIRFMLETVRPEIRQYFLESDTRRHPLQPLETRCRLSAREERPRQAPFRHAAGSLWRQFRMDQSFAGTAPGRGPRFPRNRGWHAVRPALFDIAFQHFGDELRRAQRQCDPRAQQGCQAGRLCARHRRGQLQPISPRIRRRHHLGDRERLFRLPRRGGPFSAEALCRAQATDPRSR